MRAEEASQQAHWWVINVQNNICSSDETHVSETSLPGISFTPKEVGEHVVSVKKNGKHVTNSPFRIMVGQSEIGDASKVKVLGQGLVEGHTFEVAEFSVDTRNAGDSYIHTLPGVHHSVVPRMTSE